MKFTHFFVIIPILFATSLHAQSPGTAVVTGLVIDTVSSKPLEFVNVTLRSAADSSVVRGAVTNSAGVFRLEGIRDGRYAVELRLIGFKMKRVLVTVDGNSTRIDVGKVMLSAAPVNLEEVLVTGEKPLFSSSIDRKVYNVDQDMMAKAGSVSELLQNVPSVQVDIDGSVMLRGSTNVTFMLNGKTTPLLDRYAAEALQQMPASSIERIEIITNPSAKFKPDGTAGIINIVQKKSGLPGLNGSLTGNAGNEDRYNGTVRLNYDPGMMNIFGTYSIRRDNRNRIGTDLRTLTDSATLGQSLYNDLQNSYSRPLSHTFTLGTDVRLGESDKLGVSGEYFLNDRTRTDFSRRVLLGPGASITSDYERNSAGTEQEKEYGFKTSYEHQFPGEDHTLKFETNIAAAQEKQDDIYTNQYVVPLNLEEREHIFADERTTETQVSLDYSNPFSESTSLEAGYAGEFNTAEFGNNFALYDGTVRQYFDDPIRSNLFRLSQNIHAVYGTYKQSFGEFGFLAGVRAEQAYVTSNLVTLDSVVDNSYFSIYPTMHLSYKPADAWELQLSYSRRTHRPHDDDLNPFPDYQDPRNLRAGNPYLLPEYTHSFELGCRYEHALFSVTPTLYYRHTYNEFTTVLRALNDSTFLRTEENLSTDRSGGMEVVLSGSFGDAVNAHLSANGFYNEIDASNLGYAERKSITSWSSNLTVNITFSASTRFQLNGLYRSSRQTPQGVYAPRYMLNAGLRQEFFDGKLGMTLTISDIFKSMRRKLELDTPLFAQTSTYGRDSRIVYLGLTWYFGMPPKKVRDDQMRYDESL